MNFNELNLNPNILSAIEALGFTEPTPIQAKVIATLLANPTDLVGLAQTGTGKTAAFGLPLLHLTDFKQPKPQGIVICPTRELCLQITNDFIQYAQYIKKAQFVAVYGGSSISEQIRRLKAGAQIIIATPGRLLDLMRRNVVQTHLVQYCILDEADEMLSMGFQEELDEILKMTPARKHTWLFSATMPPEAARMAKTYMTDPREITIGRPNASAANITHTCYVIKEKDRFTALKRLIDSEPEIYGLIFCRTREATRTVADKLVKEGYNAEALHGDLSQEQRNTIMRKFRERTLQLLVATDVAARGLDVDDISHVINYHLPDEAERYTHRSGRTARAGKSGAAMILVNTREVRRIPDLQRRSGVHFTMGKIPNGRDICEKQLLAMVEKMVHVKVNHEDIERYLPPVYKILKNISKEDLIQRFVSIEFNRFLDYYRNCEDINAQKPARPEPKAKAKPPVKSKTKVERQAMQRLHINVGLKDNIRQGAIVRLVCDKSGVPSAKIGHIYLKREFALFDVHKQVVSKILRALKGAKLDNRNIEIRMAGAPQFTGKKKKRKAVAK